MVPSALLNAIAGRALDGVRTLERTGPVDGSVEDPRTISGRLISREQCEKVPAPDGCPI
jgi:hypothetical protein